MNGWLQPKLPWTVDVPEGLGLAAALRRNPDRHDLVAPGGTPCGHPIICPALYGYAIDQQMEWHSLNLRREFMNSLKFQSLCSLVYFLTIVPRSLQADETRNFNNKSGTPVNIIVREFRSDIAEELGNMWFVANGKKIGGIGESFVKAGQTQSIKLEPRTNYEVEFTHTRGEFYHYIYVDCDNFHVALIAEYYWPSFNFRQKKVYLKECLPEFYMNAPKNARNVIINPNFPNDGDLEIKDNPRYAGSSAKGPSPGGDSRPKSSENTNKPADADLKTLELAPGKSYTAKEVRAAYRRLALKWHPDKNNGPGQADTTDVFQAIQAAYERVEALSLDNREP